jgi:hypothetical protein
MNEKERRKVEGWVAALGVVLNYVRVRAPSPVGAG